MTRMPLSLFGAPHSRTHFAFDERSPGVELVRPIQDNRGHAICHAVERFLTGLTRDYIKLGYVSHDHVIATIEVDFSPTDLEANHQAARELVQAVQGARESALEKVSSIH